MPVVKERDKRSAATGERMTGFVREVRSELRKVVWPTQQEAIKLTAIVIIVSAAVGVFLSAVDFTFVQFFSILLR